MSVSNVSGTCHSHRLFFGLKGPVMPIQIKGSCRCGQVSFSAESHAPVPFMRCYCSICRKTAGGGGYAINLHAQKPTLQVEGQTTVFYAELDDRDGCRTSTAERHFGSKASWVEPEIGPDDQCFEDYPEDSLEDWHRAHGLWIE